MLNSAVELPTGADRRQIGPLSVLAVHRNDALAIIDENFTSHNKALVGYANTNLINFAYRDNQIRDSLQSFLMLNDGIGLDIASFLLTGKKFPENLNGTDFTPYYIKESTYVNSIYLLGSTPESVKGAAEKFTKNCNVQIAGYTDGYSCWEISTDELIAKINASEADVLLVAFGNPKQELWMAKNRDALNIPVVFGVGALFDFTSGVKKRCPAWMQRAKIEWLHRLISEPSRLGRRYTVDLAEFFYNILCKNV